MKLKLSIVIPVFNKWNFTKACLNDLFNLSDDHEIIIVDNGSSDETQKELSNIHKSNLFCVRNKENLGFAKACNIGFTAANGPNIMFLNNDIRVKSNHFNWTQNIIDACENNVLVGPTGGYVDPKNNFQFVYETNDINKQINYMSGWCLSANADTWNKLRLDSPIDLLIFHQVFSEEFGLAYFEDVDLGFRAKKLGLQFKLVDIPVVHFGKTTSRTLNISKLYSEARNIFINKWSKK